MVQGTVQRFLLGRWVSADAAAVLAALLDLGSLRTFPAADAAFLLVTSLFFAIFLTSFPYEFFALFRRQVFGIAVIEKAGQALFPSFCVHDAGFMHTRADHLRLGQLRECFPVLSEGVDGVAPADAF